MFPKVKKQQQKNELKPQEIHTSKSYRVDLLHPKSLQQDRWQHGSPPSDAHTGHTEVPLHTCPTPNFATT